jgi:hypothetical protein
MSRVIPELRAAGIARGEAMTPQTAATPLLKGTLPTTRLHKPVARPVAATVALHGSELATGPNPQPASQGLANWNDRFMGLVSRATGGLHLFTASDLNSSNAPFFVVASVVNHNQSLVTETLEKANGDTVDRTIDTGPAPTGLFNHVWFQQEFYAPGSLTLNLESGAHDGGLFEYVQLIVARQNIPTFLSDFMPQVEALLHERAGIDVPSEQGFAQGEFQSTTNRFFTELDTYAVPDASLAINNELPVMELEFILDENDFYANP